MKLSRRILIPSMILFAVMALGLFLYNYLNTQSETHKRDVQNSNFAQAFFYSEMEKEANFALGLALQTANDPDIQAAFALRDREELLGLTQIQYQSLKEQVNISLYQFILPTSRSFLIVNNPSLFGGDDVSKYSEAVRQVSASHKPAIGMEVSQSNLNLVGVAPVFLQGQYAGAVEYGFAVNDLLAKDMKNSFGGDWRVLLTRQAVQLERPINIAYLRQSPYPDLFIATMTDETSFAQTTAYDQALAGKSAISHVRDQQNRSLTIISLPIKDFSGNILGVTDVIIDQTAEVQAQNSRLLLSIFVFLAALALGAFILSRATKQALQPLGELTQAAGLIASGDLSKQIAIRSDNEIGSLAQAFNQMTVTLRDLFEGLRKQAEERTREALSLERRTRELEITSLISRDITTEHNLDQLLTRAVDLIAQRFELYHVAVYLIDDFNEFATLRAGSGEAGHKMLDEQYRIKTGDPDNLVGYVAGSGYSRFIADLEADARLARNPLLPEAKSELAMPLSAGERAIGVLDVVSNEASAFDQNDLQILQTLADQLAVAIENARLVEQTRANLEELNHLYQEQTHKAWKGAVSSTPQAFEYDGLDIVQRKRDLPAETLKELQGGHPVRLTGTKSAGKKGKEAAEKSTLLVPLLLHGQLIGTLGLEKDNPTYEWSPDEMLMAENVATQATLALENARLIEETRRRAQKEQKISEITARIGASINMRNILQTAVEELGHAIPGSEVMVEFRNDQNHHPESS